MEYNVVDRDEKLEIPKKWGKWQTIFATLPDNKAITIITGSRAEAKRIGTTIQSTFRQGRKQGYMIRYRAIPDGDKVILYCWKEPKKGAE